MAIDAREVTKNYLTKIEERLWTLGITPENASSYRIELQSLPPEPQEILRERYIIYKKKGKKPIAEQIFNVIIKIKDEGNPRNEPGNV